MAPNFEKSPSHLLETAVNLIRQRFPEVFGIYLFGSFGTAYQTKESDIDLALLPSHPIDPVALWELSREISLAVHREVDLIDLRGTSTVFRYVILSEGRRIFCQDAPACDATENLYLSMYLRFNESRRELIQERRSHG